VERTIGAGSDDHPEDIALGGVTGTAPPQETIRDL
jgi:hypothetical protein